MNQEETNLDQPITSKKFNEMYEAAGHTLYLEWSAGILKENEELKQQSIFLCRWDNFDDCEGELKGYSQYIKAKTARQAIEKLVLNLDESFEVIKIRYRLYHQNGLKGRDNVKLEKLFNELISLGLLSENPDTDDCQYYFSEYDDSEEFSKRYHEVVVNNLNLIVDIFEEVGSRCNSFSIMNLNKLPTVLE